MTNLSFTNQKFYSIKIGFFLQGTYPILFISSLKCKKLQKKLNGVIKDTSELAGLITKWVWIYMQIEFIAIKQEKMVMFNLGKLKSNGILTCKQK